jgi:hypothetical protein
VRLLALLGCVQHHSHLKRPVDCCLRDVLIDDQPKTKHLDKAEVQATILELYEARSMAPAPVRSCSTSVLQPAT